MTNTLKVRRFEAPEPTCSNCRHGIAQPLDASNFGQPRPLECHRYPPTAHPVFTGPAQFAGAISLYPPVQPLQTCGEFAPGSAGVEVAS